MKGYCASEVARVCAHVSVSARCIGVFVIEASDWTAEELQVSTYVKRWYTLRLCRAQKWLFGRKTQPVLAQGLTQKEILWQKQCSCTNIFTYFVTHTAPTVIAGVVCQRIKCSELNNNIHLSIHSFFRPSARPLSVYQFECKFIFVTTKKNSIYHGCFKNIPLWAFILASLVSSSYW